MTNDDIQAEIQTKVRMEIAKYTNPERLDESFMSGAKAVASSALAFSTTSAAAGVLIALGFVQGNSILMLGGGALAYAGQFGALMAVPVLKRFFDDRELRRTIQNAEKVIRERDFLIKAVDAGETPPDDVKQKIERLTNQQQRLFRKLKGDVARRELPISQEERRQLDAILQAGERGAISALPERG